MGSAVCDAVRAATDLDLVATLDSTDTIDAHSLNGAEVAIEFTTPCATRANTETILAAGTHAVVGTTGWDETGFDAVRHACDTFGTHALIAPNFALSAVLAMRFAATAAPLFDSVEIIEAHHPNKVDAPSGTAWTTAEMVARARRNAGRDAASPDATESDPLGARGAVIDGVHVHAIRAAGRVAHEEIILGNPGETLTIRTDCIDRASFMPGVLLAARFVLTQPGLTVGLEPVIDAMMVRKAR